MEGLRSVIWLLFAIFVNESQGVSVAEDLTLTSEQKSILEIFKTNVVSKLSKDYQHSDIYLIRWLRAKNFDVGKAEQLLMHDIIWRQEENMDTIRDEDWSAFQKEYPYTVDSHDNEGRPMATLDFADWDFRKAVLSGQRDKLIRWLTNIVDHATSRVREVQAQGTNVTQWKYIINLKGFNLVQHACIQCLPIYVAFVTNYENHYPGSLDKIFLLNAPAIFDTVLSLVRPIMSPDTRDALETVDNNEAGKSQLFKGINPDQIPQSFGGTKLTNKLY